MTGATPSSRGRATPPGWYPAPNGAPGQRYWDGLALSDIHSAPATEHTEGRFTIHYGFALLAIFSLLGTLIPAVLLMSTATSSTCALSRRSRRRYRSG